MTSKIGQASAWLRGVGAGPLSPRIHSPAIFPAVLCFALIWPFGGGWKSLHMLAGANTPGAQGTVKYKIGDNGNTALDVLTRSLAPPSSLNPPENTYVVWVQPPGTAPKNYGALRVNSQEQGELKTETPYKRFKIFITAEENPQVQAPMAAPVLSADITEN